MDTMYNICHLISHALVANQIQIQIFMFNYLPFGHDDKN